jgi:murein L,D-transpeptidase YafK
VLQLVSGSGVFVIVLLAAGIFPVQGKMGPAAVDRVVVNKGARQLMLLKDGEVIKSYQVALGKDPVGPKMQQGDGKTPEGIYRLDRRNTCSRFYKSIHISYPGPADRKAASARGISPGGDVMIHGLPNGLGKVGELHTLLDWTNGCIAVTNDEMDEIWQLVADGTPIEIRP